MRCGGRIDCNKRGCTDHVHQWFRAVCVGGRLSVGVGISLPAARVCAADDENAK